MLPVVVPEARIQSWWALLEVVGTIRLSALIIAPTSQLARFLCFAIEHLLSFFICSLCWPNFGFPIFNFNSFLSNVQLFYDSCYMKIPRSLLESESPKPSMRSLSCNDNYALRDLFFFPSKQSTVSFLCSLHTWKRNHLKDFPYTLKLKRIFLFFFCFLIRLRIFKINCVTACWKIQFACHISVSCVNCLFELI